MTMHSHTRTMVGKMLVELMAGDCTTQELIEASGFVNSTVREWVRDLRATRALRISAWEKVSSGQTMRPVYSLNPEGKPDVPRPKAKKGNERTARYRLRKQLRERGMPPAQIEQAVSIVAPMRKAA